jgi:hypothetical protein
LDGETSRDFGRDFSRDLSHGFTDAMRQAICQAFWQGLTQAFRQALTLAFSFKSSFEMKPTSNSATTDYLARSLRGRSTSAAASASLSQLIIPRSSFIAHHSSFLVCPPITHYSPFIIVRS